MDVKGIVKKMTLEEKCYLLSGKDFWQTRAVERLEIPELFLSDGPHGIRKQEGASDQLGLNASIPATCFPTAATVANSWNTELGETIGKYLGVEARAQGVSVLLGPGLNIKRNPLCGRNFEYFSEDPYLAGKMAASYIRGIQSLGVAACPKHFAANSQELRRMASNSVVDERTLRELYLTGFEIAVKEGHAKSIMASYNQINGTYANENTHLLQEILREEWGFDGFVVSDWGASNDHAAGVEAGSNLEMPGTGGDSDEELLAAVGEGRIREEQIDERVEELLKVILAIKAISNPKKETVFSEAEHHRMAQKAAEESIVLLKNENQILPLMKECRVAVIGDFAETPRYQGAGSSMVNPTRLDTTISLLGQYFPANVGFAPGYNRRGAVDGNLEDEAIILAKKADAVLYYMGLDESAESEGIDRKDMKLAKNQLRLLKKLSKVNPHIVVVLAGGAPVEMDWEMECEAIVHGYLGGQAGAAAMLRVIRGEVNPSGKLSETYPLRYEDLPTASGFPEEKRNVEYREGLYVGYRYFETVKKPVRYPFGYGLSYTSFAYSDLKIERKEVRFTVTNTGNVAGAEVAQLYVSANCHGIYRPVKELKGFAKVYLKPGEEKQVVLPLDDKAFRYFNTFTNRFEIETGDYELQIGASCTDVRLSGSLFVQGTEAPPPVEEDEIPSYFSGRIEKVSDREFAALLGGPLPEKQVEEALEWNDTLGEMYRAKSWIGRSLYHFMERKMEKELKAGKSNANVIFVYNMTFRGLARLTGGRISRKMAEGFLQIVNGNFWKGFGQMLSGIWSQQKIRRKIRKKQKR